MEGTVWESCCCLVWCGSASLAHQISIVLAEPGARGVPGQDPAWLDWGIHEQSQYGWS